LVYLSSLVTMNYQYSKMTDRGYKLHEGLHGVQVLGVIKFGGGYVSE